MNWIENGRGLFCGAIQSHKPRKAA